VKISTDRKSSSYIAKSCFEKSQNYKAQVTAELNIHLKDPVSTKTVRRELHKSNILGRAAISKPLITENDAQMRNGGVTTIKPGHRTTGNARVVWSDE
jgi:hypothetical protein